MKIKLPILSLALLCGMATANATLYQFTNALGDGDTSNVANYVVLNEGQHNFVWNLAVIFPENYKGEKIPEITQISTDGTPTYHNVFTKINTYKAATTLPTASDTILYSSYHLAEAEADGTPVLKDNGTQKYTELPAYSNRVAKFKNTMTVGNFYQRGLQNIKLGSSDSTDEKFTLTVKEYAQGYTGACSIKKDANVAQTYFEIKTTSDFESHGGSLSVGDAGTENYIDKLSVGGMFNLVGNTVVNSYIKEIDVAGNFILQKAAKLNIFFAENLLTATDAIITIGGDFNLADGSTIQNINLDFSALDFSEVKAGDKFDLISATTITGFDTTDTSVNFTYDGVSASLEPEYGSELVWNGNTLQLVITGEIPEPSTIALIFGAIAVAFVAIRRRK